MRQVILAYGVGAAIISIGLYFSITNLDPYMFKRFGALTTAYAALLVLIQILLENKFERIKEKDRPNYEVPDTSPAMDKFVDRFKFNKFRIFVRQRTGIALCIAFFAVVGEVIHGFGDYFIHFLIPH
jgi:hypothetical protein